MCMHFPSLDTYCVEELRGDSILDLYDARNWLQDSTSWQSGVSYILFIAYLSSNLLSL